MATQNATVTGVSLASGNPSGSASLLKAFYVTMDLAAAYTGSADTFSCTGILTAIAASERNGKTLTLIGAMTCHPGADTANLLAYPTGASVWAMTLANTTTTGDITGNLSDVAGAELTATTGATTGIMVLVVVKEA